MTGDWEWIVVKAGKKTLLSMTDIYQSWYRCMKNSRDANPRETPDWVYRKALRHWYRRLCKRLCSLICRCILVTVF